MGYAQRILTGVIQSQLQDPRYRPVLKTAHVVEMQQRMWYNLDLNSPQYMVPGIVIVLLTIISMMLA
jgi:hypothetical protein